MGTLVDPPANAAQHDVEQFTNPVVIRGLAPQDGVAYRALRLRALRDHPDAFTSSFEEESARPLAWSVQRLASQPQKPCDFFLGAFQQSLMVGMVGLQGRYRPKERHNATVVGLYVVPELAGQGVGGNLMQRLIERASTLDALEQLQLTVTEGNRTACALYARCGFVEFGTLQRAIKIQDQYYAKVHMVLRLHAQ